MTYKPLKIAQVVASTGNGGLEKHAYDLSSGLVDKGHQVSFITTSVLAPRVPKNVNVSVLPLDGNRHNPVVLFQLGQELRAGNFDIIHAQGSKAAQMIALIKWALPNSAVIVGTLHNKKRNVKAFRKLDHAIGVSKALTNDIGGKRSSTIYHGLNQTLWNTEDVTIKRNGRPVLLAIGRLVEAKGFDLLLAAWPSVDADLLVLGDGPETDHLAKQIDQLGLGDKVTLMGRSENIAGYLRAADGVVVSSRREGFSYVVAEALLCRCPVTSTDVPVANEVLDQDLILKTEPVAISNKLIELTKDIPAWKALCEPAFSFAAREFSYQGMIDKTERLYLDLVAT
ncbi:glycosyltransferase [Thalassospira sp. MA62]|nr:glycosyltransferase [Thalassospira sp. MA62]